MDEKRCELVRRREEGWIAHQEAFENISQVPNRELIVEVRGSLAECPRNLIMKLERGLDDLFPPCIIRGFSTQDESQYLRCHRDSRRA